MKLERSFQVVGIKGRESPDHVASPEKSKLFSIKISDYPETVFSL
jgi:hypothetical protein